jgi:hypothetical protein
MAADRRSRTRRTFQLEDLEGRSMPSTALVAHPAAEVVHAQAIRVVTVHGVMTGQVSPSGSAAGQVINFVAVGKGVAGVFGPVTFTGAFNLTLHTSAPPSNAIANGTGSVSSLKWGHATITFSGTETIVSQNRGIVGISGSASIDAGTLSGGYGKFYATGFHYINAHQYAMNFTAVLTLPR